MKQRFPFQLNRRQCVCNARAELEGSRKQQAQQAEQQRAAEVRF